MKFDWKFEEVDCEGELWRAEKVEIGKGEGGVLLLG